MRSGSVDFRWSMWAMIEKLRMRVGSRIGRMYGSRDAFAGATGGLTTARAGCHHRARDATCRKCGGRDGAAGARCVDPTAARRLRGALVTVGLFAIPAALNAVLELFRSRLSVPNLALLLANPFCEEPWMRAFLQTRLGQLGWQAPLIVLASASAQAAYHLYHEPVRRAEDCVPSGRRRRAGVPAAGQLRPLSFVGLRPGLRRRRVLRAPARAASSTSDQRASRSTDRPGQPGARTRPRLAVSATA